MKVFPDTNFWVAAGLRPEGDYMLAMGASTDTFVTSEHILSELERNLRRLRKDPNAFIAKLRKICFVTDQFDVLPAGLPLQGAGDRQALAEAIGESCDLFVTSDSDFSALIGQRVKGVLVLSSREYVRRVLTA